jgi:hypothetical protein
MQFAAMMIRKVASQEAVGPPVTVNCQRNQRARGVTVLCLVAGVTVSPACVIVMGELTARKNDSSFVGAL